MGVQSPQERPHRCVSISSRTKDPPFFDFRSRREATITSCCITRPRAELLRDTKPGHRLASGTHIFTFGTSRRETNRRRFGRHVGKSLAGAVNLAATRPTTGADVRCDGCPAPPTRRLRQSGSPSPEHVATPTLLGTATPDPLSAETLERVACDTPNECIPTRRSTEACYLMNVRLGEQKLTFPTWLRDLPAHTLQLPSQEFPVTKTSPTRHLVFVSPLETLPRLSPRQQRVL